MLILSDARITVKGRGKIAVEGGWAPHGRKIAAFIADVGLERGTVSHRFGSCVFSRHIPDGVRQRLRNFLVNECPLK